MSYNVCEDHRLLSFGRDALSTEERTFCLMHPRLKHASLTSISGNGFDSMTCLKHVIGPIFVASCRGARVFEAVAPEKASSAAQRAWFASPPKTGAQPSLASFTA